MARKLPVGMAAFREKVRAAHKNHRERAAGLEGRRVPPLTETEIAYLRELQDHLWDFLAADAVCVYCATPLTREDFSLDHDVPLQRGGEFCAGNVVICCLPCNEYKGMLSGKEYRRLRSLVSELPPEVQKDFWARLRNGGGRFGRRR